MICDLAYLLRRNVERHRPQVDFCIRIGTRNDEEKSWKTYHIFRHRMITVGPMIFIEKYRPAQNEIVVSNDNVVNNRQPGPLASCSNSLPRRNMTALSYSWTTYATSSQKCTLLGRPER